MFMASHEISQFFENTRKCFELLALHLVQAYDDTQGNTIPLGKRIILNLYFYSIISNIFRPALGLYQGKHSSTLLKGKAVPLQAWAGPESSRGFRLPDFKTVGT